MVNLFEAIIQKNTQKVKSILEQGANPNSIIDASGLSAMHFACQSTAGIFEYLLEGVDQFSIEIVMEYLSLNVRQTIR